MTQKFADKITGSADYRRIVRRRAMTLREQALLHLACSIAERELGQLRVTNARQQGDLRVQEQQTRFALLLSQGGAAARQSLLFLVTPYSEMSSRWGPQPVPDRDLLPSPDTFVSPGGGMDALALSGAPRLENAELASGGDKPAAEPDVAAKKPDAIAGKPTTVPDATVKRVDATALRFMKSFLPKVIREPLLIAARFVSRLSPMTTVIALALVVAGSIGFAAWHGAWVNNSLDLANQQLKLLEGYKEKYDAQVIELETIKEDLQKLEGENAVSAASIENQELVIKERDDTIEKLRQEHKVELEATRTAGNAAAMEAFAKQTDQLVAAEAEKASLANQLAAANDALETARRNNEPLRKQVTANKATISGLEKKLKTFEVIESERESLRAFSADLMSGVKNYLLVATADGSLSKRAEFKAHYKRIYERDSALFDQIGLPKPASLK